MVGSNAVSPEVATDKVAQLVPALQSQQPCLYSTQGGPAEVIEGDPSNQPLLQSSEWTGRENYKEAGSLRTRAWPRRL